MSQFNVSLLLTADAGQAEAALKAAQARLRELGRGAGEAAEGTAQLAREEAGLARALAAGSGAILSRLAGLAAATLSVTALTRAVAGAVRTWSEAERQQLTVAQVIRATGGAAGRTAEDIERMSRAIARDTLASTPGVRAAAAQLLTFRSIAADTFDRTLVAAQDLAAVGFGSVESAAVQLGKALEDPAEGVAALREVGVSFAASQRGVIQALVDTGRAAEAQRLILEAVELQVGGAGAAAGAGLAGKFDLIGEEIARFAELVGKAAADNGLETLLEGVANGIGRISDALDEPTDTELRRELAELRAEWLRLQDARDRAEANPRAAGRGRGAAFGREAADVESRMAGVAAQLAEREAARVAAAEAAARAEVERRREAYEAVTAALTREIGLLDQSALQQEAINQAKRAGVDLASAEGREIERLVRLKAEAQGAAQGERMLAELQAQAEMMRLIALHGEDSRQVTEARLEAEYRALDAMAESAGVSDELRGRLLEAFTHYADLARVDVARSIGAATAEAARLAAQLSIGLDAARKLAAERWLADNAPGGKGYMAEQYALYGQGQAAMRRLTRESGPLFGNPRVIPAPAAARGGAGGGGAAARAEADAVGQLIARLQEQLELSRALNPVQEEMLRYREQLATATAAERAQVEQLITARLAEAQAAAAAQRQAAAFGQTLESSLDALLFRGQSVEKVIGDIVAQIGRAALQTAIWGRNAQMLGGRGGFGGGGLLDLVGGLFGLGRRSGALPNGVAGVGLYADGGPVHGPGGPTDDRIPALLSDGEFVVNARATSRHRALLEAINAGSVPRFATGGPVGSAGNAGAAGLGGIVFAPQITVDAPGGDPAAVERAAYAGMRAALADYSRLELPGLVRGIASDPRRLR